MNPYCEGDPGDSAVAFTTTVCPRLDPVNKTYRGAPDDVPEHCQQRPLHLKQKQRRPRPIYTLGRWHRPSDTRPQPYARVARVLLGPGGILHGATSEPMPRS